MDKHRGRTKGKKGSSSKTKITRESPTTEKPGKKRSMNKREAWGGGEREGMGLAYLLVTRKHLVTGDGVKEDVGNPPMLFLTWGPGPTEGGQTPGTMRGQKKTTLK